MKKANSKKVHVAKRFLYDPLIGPIQKLFKLIGYGIRPASRSTFPVESESDKFLTYDKLQKANVQLLRLEMLRAKAIRLVRERARCL